MQFEKFEQLLKAKHPEAEVRQTKHGLDINFTPHGKVYSYQGTIEHIAEHMKLVEVWYVYRNGDVCGKAHGEAEAKTVEAREIERDAVVAKAWQSEPSTFTIGRVS